MAPALTRRPASIRIGCSGWEYGHWRRVFYPADVPRRRWFTHYASVFDTVEINNTFYRLPDPSTIRSWAAGAPPGFLYAVKASRYLTHLKRLRGPNAPLRLFFDRVRELGHHLGPVLYQLPPRWNHDQDRLEAFLAAIPRGIFQVIEFRDPRWYRDEVFEALEQAGVALCLHDMPGSASPPERVGPFVYARFHGADAAYRGGYPARTLRRWATWLARQSADGFDVYAYFNNDVDGHAPNDAVRLRRLLGSTTLGTRAGGGRKIR